MFVSESSLFSKPTMKLRVTGMDGTEIVLEVDPEITVDKLKMDVICHMFGQNECVKTSLYHRLLHVESGKGLDEEKSLSQAGLKDQDEVILIKKRNATPVVDPSIQKKEESKRTPNADMIAKSTQEESPKNCDRKLKESATTVDFQAELRKILISLIDAAQKILCLNPEAAKIFEDAEKFMEEQTATESQVDEAAMKQLEDMGFPRERASKALILNKMSTVEAIQWMLEHEEDADIDQPLAVEATAVAAAAETAKPPSKSYVSQAGGGQPRNMQSESQAQQLAKESGPQKVVKMMESFRAYRRKEFKPSPRSLQNLIEMGFDEKDAVDALRINGNREEDACEWLLSGSNRTIKEEDLDEGLDPSSTVYKAIMANPVVQLGLNNPRSLIAFLHMLENPNSTQQWLNDPDTGPMLIQISRIYHAEKHAPGQAGSSANES